MVANRREHGKEGVVKLDQIHSVKDCRTYYRVIILAQVRADARLQMGPE